MSVSYRAATPVAFAVLLTAACSAGSGSNGSGFGGSFAPGTNDNTGGSSGTGTANGGESSSGTSTSGSSTGPVMLPPEMKTESTFRAPVATGNVVWSANPTSGRVAYIDATTFNVQITSAGDAPTYLAAVNDPVTHDDVAIVLNVLSQDATLLRVHDKQLQPPETFASTADANSWAVSSTGRWAIAWADSTLVSNPDPTQGFQHVAVMDLTRHDASPSTVLAVGYRPAQVAFSGDDSLAFAVTEEGISVIDLTGAEPAVIRQDPLSAASSARSGDAGSSGADAASHADAEAGADAAANADSSTHADAADTGAGSGGDDATESDSGDDGSPGVATSTVPDVSFTPDGSYALVRQDGLAAITVDHLKDGTLTTIALPAEATDLTVAQDGTFAVAALRDISTVAVIPIPGVLTAPASIKTIPITGAIVGRVIVTKDEKSVLIFTTAAAVDSLTVLTLASSMFRTIPLFAPVEAVFPTDDGNNAIVLHQVQAATNAMVQGAFSVVPIAQSLPALIQSLPAPPTAVAIAPTSDRAIVSIRNDTSLTYGLYMTLMPSQQVLQYSLASPPTAVGIAAGAQRGYVAQDYSEGRITFVDLSEGTSSDAGAFAARTITGFELNASIVTGGK